ncbi:hypothetical protein HQ520_05790, partial [bacterium]|nr:hypothetical protein [bacterium]
PCLALWCGNNELEQGSVGDVWTWHDMSWDDYKALFDDLLGRLVREHDPETDYWPSSPHSPACDRKDYNNPGCGDAHLWSVWHGKQPFEWYRTTTHRFCSEFGFQSFPEPLTVQGFTQPEDRNITAYVMEHHQRSGIGNTTIMQYLLDWFRLPGDFEMTLWLSQITQGMAMKYAIEHWRRNMPRSMGALYWQLNDCWPVASWASIDYHNRWKALHYMARLFFDRVLVSGVEDLEKGTVDVHITSDILEALQGDLLCVVTSVGGETLLEKETPIKIAPNSSHLVHTLDLRRLIEERGVRDLVVWLELKVDGKVVSTNLVHFARPKHLELQDPRFAAAFEKMGERQFRLSLLCEAPALWTWIEIEGCDARLTDNFFHLRPGVRKELVIETVKPLDEAKFRERLHVRSLVDTY